MSCVKDKRHIYGVVNVFKVTHTFPFHFQNPMPQDDPKANKKVEEEDDIFQPLPNMSYIYHGIYTRMRSLTKYGKISRQVILFLQLNNLSCSKLRNNSRINICSCAIFSFHSDYKFICCFGKSQFPCSYESSIVAGRFESRPDRVVVGAAEALSDGIVNTWVFVAFPFVVFVFALFFDTSSTTAAEVGGAISVAIHDLQ